MTADPIAGQLSQSADRQSPSGAGVIAPVSTRNLADAAAAPLSAASAFLAGVVFNESEIWPRERTVTLVEMWFAGASTQAIGDKIGISKNAVVGKVHRLDLPGRPSPIIRRAVAPPPPAPPPPAPPPPPDKAPAPPKPPRVVRAAEPLPVLPKEPPPPVRAAGCPAPVPPPPPEPRFQPRALSACRWPFGHPRTPAFRFCGDASRPGLPYCPVHMRKAYVTESKTKCA